MRTSITSYSYLLLLLLKRVVVGNPGLMKDKTKVHRESIVVLAPTCRVDLVLLLDTAGADSSVVLRRTTRGRGEVW